MEKKMETPIMSCIGTTLSIHSFIPSLPKASPVPRALFGQRAMGAWSLDLAAEFPDPSNSKKNVLCTFCVCALGLVLKYGIRDPKHKVTNLEDANLKSSGKKLTFVTIRKISGLPWKGGPNITPQILQFLM